MTSSDSQIDKPQRGGPKRTELPDVNINTGTQSINTESFFRILVTFKSETCFEAWLLTHLQRALIAPNLANMECREG